MRPYWPKLASLTKTSCKLYTFSLFVNSLLPNDNNLTLYMYLIKVSKDAKIRNRYSQVPHPTQDTKGKVTNSQSRILTLVLLRTEQTQLRQLL